MRRVVVVVVTALALAGSAAAASQPPVKFHWLKALPVIDLPRAGHNRESCSVHARQTKSSVARGSRKLAPVACEQPPRSHVRDAGSVVILAP